MHNHASNQSTGTDYKPDKSPPNPINATISAKPPSKNITLILGDSNTKYTFIPNSFRNATYVIEDIDPEMCREYKSVWIHCGVNNLKPTRCHSIKDVRDIFNLFIEKLNSIKQLCPFTKVIVSPILPTGLRALNNRIRYFNRLLFNVPNWWVEIPIYSFLDKDCKLADIYRSYHIKNDYIHLGAVGIRSLVAKVKDALSRVDGRSYASVINGCHFTNRP